jgi:hypothetical protein
VRGQNKAQQMGSASTYARRYALCAALGIVTGDDDDGNGGAPSFIDADEAREIDDLVDACRGLGDFKEPVFWQFAGATKSSEILVSRLADALSMLKRKLGKMK